jgi:acyl-CoA synthetase (AMP-forming)/AMP-acid ligase II
MNRTSNVAHYLLDGKDPARVALRMIDRDHTYGELQSAGLEVAKYLLLRGGQKGDRVLLVSENSLFWVAAYLGILQSGMVCVPLPTSIPAPDLDFIQQNTEARFAFAQARFLMSNKDRLLQIQAVSDREISTLPAVVSFAKARDEAAKASLDMVPVEASDLAALMFTSGSTGRPRGVMVSHQNIVANTESIVEYLALTEADRIMAVLPFHYCFGTSLLHTHLRVGASLVVDLRFMYPEKVLERMLDTECTGFAGVPSHFQILLGKSSLRHKSLPKLRYVQQAGGHLAPNFVRELRQALPTTQVFVMYGQTEATARLSYVPPEVLERKLGSIGKGIPGVKLRAINDAGADVRPGETGEIVAEGANVTQGYWRDPEETAISFRDGRLYTGDLGTVDEEGFIYVVDRAKDFLKCGGKRVSCRQLEEKLLEFTELLEVAVVGVHDEILGEAVKAFVVPRQSDFKGLEQQLRTFCKEQLPHQLVPKDIVVMDVLPKNSAGKVLKHNLKSLKSIG